jgi:hypothetical protein
LAAGIASLNLAEGMDKIYGLISENGNWHSRYNHELYQLYEDSEIIKVIKAGR